MKKTATKVSGILTLICAIILSLVAIVMVCANFKVTFVTELINSVEFLQLIFTYFEIAFIIIPITLINMLTTSIAAETLQTVMAIVLTVFALFMVFCGIKEISIAKRDDEEFAHCKKTCWFFYLTKFMFFAYVVFVIISTFTMQDVKLCAALFEFVAILLLNIQNLFLYITIAIAVIALALFLLPVINIAVVAKAVKNGGVSTAYQTPDQNIQNGMAGGDQQQPNQFYQTTPQPTMQANMPPLPNYNMQPNATNPVNNAQPATPNPAVMPNTTVAPNPAATPNVTAMPNATVNSNPTPGAPVGAQPEAPQVILNSKGQPLSEKGQADLERLERLKGMGAITEENYQAMKNKILQGD